MPDDIQDQEPTQDAIAAGQLTPPMPGAMPPQPGAGPSPGALSGGNIPLLVKLIGGLIKPSSVSKGGLNRPPSRADVTLDFMGHFLTSLAGGLAASGHGPGANARGFAGAMMQPQQQQMLQQHLEQQRQAQQSKSAEEEAHANYFNALAQMTVPQARVEAERLKGQFGTEREKSKEEAVKSIAAGKEASAEKIAGLKATSAQSIANANLMGRLQIAKSREGLQRDLAAQKLSVAKDPNAATVATKNMAQLATGLLPHITRIEAMTDQVASSLGPIAGRWNDIWTGKIGATDPTTGQLYKNYVTQVGFLQTGIMLAHARGRMSNVLFNHFIKMFDAGKQSPENMKAALSVAREWMQGYADLPGLIGSQSNKDNVPKAQKWNPVTGRYE